ncbi:two-component system chemotaxis sensor kinase CheA [Herbaspirillum sp. Sphag1AN]|uniref:chemotaxis protein CheA n=1 Tax=unclassified Herbaspirillum TaxID=2624150 RepID=UPI00160BAB19|nr:MULTISPECIES: chemotaxis protein CheA [unclassified Herbaspirillum]MBB3210939.1 two-component system chemotaxis sensor kinase CheA [Herbaspirillum sp. Sphag1AN]MBB3244569.1 two-component system chemotaxis sensor kinase CheA [Herbaspirillum sp. Sphag64]
MTIDMSQFFQVFFDEADEGLAEMEKLLLAVNVSDPDDEDLNAIFRAAHSIKGGSATFGLTDIAEVTHVLESLLDRVRQGQMALTSQHVDAFLAAKDILKSMLDGHRHGTAVDLDAVADLRMLLQSLSEGTVDKVETAPQKTSANSVLSRYLVELPILAERDIEALEQELGLIGTVQKTVAADGSCTFVVDSDKGSESIIDICTFLVNSSDLKISQAPIPSKEEQQGYGFFAPFVPQDATDEERGYGFFEPFVPVNATDRERGYGFFEPFVPLDIEQSKRTSAPVIDVDDAPALSALEHSSEKKAKGDKPAASVPESSSIRVGIEKVDQLINLVGELVITQAMIEQRTGVLDPMLHEHLLNSVSQLTRNTRDLQEAVMSIRMMPMDYVFSRFPRMVRDLAAKLGKRVEFVTHGAATELDKGLIERIVDPLTHLVRNSIDHGIETPDTRLAAGKTDYGTLSLSAEHQGGNIIIEVTDDGGGLNRDKILAKARQQGMSTSDNASDSEVWQLIFEPGFSTADQVTDVSGRGVGMDVVKRNILAMGGAVDIRSVKGFGTTISISLPLTLAILDGMSIRIGHEVYILPLGYVVESLQPATQDIKDISGQGRVIKVRGEYLPLLPLYQIFNIEPTFTDPSQGLVVILESDGKKAALFVDDLIGQQQIVVKNLESNYRKVAGISGATILGDGGVALIVDVAALLRSSRQLNDESVFS